MLLCAAVFTSCKKDEKDKLNGKWALKRIATTVVVNGQANMMKDSLLVNNNYYLQLNSNKSGSSNIPETYKST